MSGETQARRRKDKKKKDSVSDEGTGDEELKEHPAEGGSSCLTVLVFLVLLAGVSVLLGLIYVQSQGIAHVDTPAPPPVAAPRVETVVETITEGGDSPPPADDQGEGAPAGQPEGDAPVEVVEQVIEEHIVYVDAPPDGQPQQAAYEEAPQPVGIQLEGSEPQLEEQFAAPPAGPPPPTAEQVVREEKLVRMRQVVKQITDADGTVREEIVSEEEVEDGAEEPTADQTVEPEQQQQSEPEQQQQESEPEQQPESEPEQQQEEAATEVDEGVDMTEPAEDSAPPPVEEVTEEAVVEAEEAAPAAETVVEAEEPPQVSEAEVPPQEDVSEAVEDVSPREDVPAAEVVEGDAAPQEGVPEAEVVEDAPQGTSEAEVEEEAPQETAEAAVEEEAAPPEEELTEAAMEDEPQEQRQQDEVAPGAEPPAPASVPPTDSVPVGTNTKDRAAETDEKPAEAVRVRDEPKEPVKQEKPKESVKDEKPKEPVKEKPKETVKEEKPKEPVKEESTREPKKEEKPKEAVKEDKLKESVKEEKPKEPVKEGVKEPVKEEKAKEAVKEEKMKESEDKKKVKESIKDKPQEPVKEEKPIGKSAKQSETKPTEAPVKKDEPTEKPKAAAPTEKPVVKAVPTEKPAPKTSAKEAEEIARVRSGEKEPKKQPDAASSSAAGRKEQAARPDPPVERDTDKHAKQTAQTAAPAADEGIVSDIGADEPADTAEYDKADITGPEDWDIRGELDAADNLVDTDDQAALGAFGAILARRPRSPRALWGRARALNAQAMRERSNNVLDRAIRAFREALDLDLEPESPVPPELYRRVAETCVQQMRFRGDLEQAARVQQRMIQKFPDDYLLRNHLATVFMTYGQNAAAEEVLQEVLRRWPNNGYAKVHLGFIRRQQGRHEPAVELMQAGLDSDEPGVHDNRFYYALGDSYDRVGRRDLALKTYEEGVSRGLLLSVLQRSLINVDRLTGRPYWTAEQSGSQELIRALEGNFATIRGEMLSLLDSERPEDGFQPEQEQLSKTGDWKQYTIFQRGRKNKYACVKTPRTCEIIDKFPEAAGCRRGQVKFSMLAPGTTVWPHTGPTNCRLRLHLGLKVPNGTGIRVAGEKRTWEEGKVLIIDDSFEHDVWNEGDAARFVLIVDIWHPELTAEERRTLPSI